MPRSLPGSAGKIARNVGGCVLILAGIAGLVLPFLQGIALIIAGFLLLEFDGKEALINRVRGHRLGRWVEERWRQVHARLKGDGGSRS